MVFFKTLSIKLIFLLILIILLTSCMHRPLNKLPDNWQNKKVPIENLDDADNQSCMQIVICYAGLGCAHTLMRLYIPKMGSILWDPGGGYATHDYAKTSRHNDVISKKAPTMREYFKWRHHFKFSTNAIEIFEYDISVDQATKLWTILANEGTDKNHPQGNFRTATPGSFCSYKVSMFLEKFCLEIVEIKHSLLPHSLAESLYKKKVDRVYIYRNGALELHYPPSKAIQK
jgi:hypothetical protein